MQCMHQLHISAGGLIHLYRAMIHLEWRSETVADGTAPKTPQSDSDIFTSMFAQSNNTDVCVWCSWFRPLFSLRGFVHSRQFLHHTVPTQFLSCSPRPPAICTKSQSSQPQSTQCPHIISASIHMEQLKTFPSITTSMQTLSQ